MTDTISTRSGLALQIERQTGEQNVEISLLLEPAKNCVLHWGLREPGKDVWRLPPQQAWPADTKPAGAAAQTPFARDNGHRRIVFQLPKPVPYSSLEFVLFFPDQKAWDNNQGQNYRIEIPQAAADKVPAPGPRPDLKLRSRTRPAGGRSCFSERSNWKEKPG